ncbi:SH3 domain-containing protein [Kiloniella laminariae]|uniref:SH3 domain-containing protein n=1 Tax=Kiloniella laminariae TaxID=454162 RepID=A0ABT4LJP6_9PROT|nr:SH3 domain-containing protein [Kiloniella laminariae]MCZ4281328.1 SH3 domain-containing protein [Kiloniella laminariae]
MKFPALAIIASLLFGLFFFIPPTMPPAFAESSKEEAPRTVGPSGLPLPRFVSFRSGQVNVRAGPGIRYPISWIYHRKGLPVEIIDEFDTWRQIKDWQGTQGWVHQSMLKGQRSVMITGTLRTLYDDPDSNSRPIAQAEAGVIGELESCNSDDWCQVEIRDISGWIERSSFYGAYSEEVFD